MMEKQKRRKVKLLRSDNGSEYISTELKKHLANEDIEH